MRRVHARRKWSVISCIKEKTFKVQSDAYLSDGLISAEVSLCRKEAGERKK